MQCKDLPDMPILQFLADLQCRWGTWYDYTPRPENTVLHAMPPGTPTKLALAKMRTLKRRSLIDGCFCGCRGDFELTGKGMAVLKTAQAERDQGASDERS